MRKKYRKEIAKRQEQKWLLKRRFLLSGNRLLLNEIYSLFLEKAERCRGRFTFGENLLKNSFTSFVPGYH
jgi:hypothetical protein